MARAPFQHQWIRVFGTGGILHFGRCDCHLMPNLVLLQVHAGTRPVVIIRMRPTAVSLCWAQLCTHSIYLHTTPQKNFYF